jgi:hypothetical protein
MLIVEAVDISASSRGETPRQHRIENVPQFREALSDKFDIARQTEKSLLSK